MISWLKRVALEGEDRLRYSPHVRRWLSSFQLLRASRAFPRDNQALARSIRDLCTATRLAADHDAIRTGMARIHRHLEALDPDRINWSEFVPHDADRRLARAALLKPFLGEREKGVVFISFESEWLKLLRHGQARAVAERYALVLAPSGSPHNLTSYVFPRAFPGTLFTLISQAEEKELFPRISPKYHVVPLYASSWVNPDLIRPRPRRERDIDLVMVANFAKFKRHYALFKALRTMPDRLRILVIGQDQDARTVETILKTARCYGVADRFALVCNAPWGRLPRPWAAPGPASSCRGERAPASSWPSRCSPTPRWRCCAAPRSAPEPSSTPRPAACCTTATWPPSLLTSSRPPTATPRAPGPRATFPATAAARSSTSR